MDNQPEYIDLRVVVRKLWDRRKTFFKVLPVVFVVSCAYTLCLPRYYRSDLQVVPELGVSQGGGGLADLASSFGIDLGNAQTSDAISPLLYPDLMTDNGFVAGLFSIRVKSGLLEEDEEPIDTTYYAYIQKFQKSPFWAKAIRAVKRLMAPKNKGGAIGGFDPYYVSRDDDALMNKMRDDITIAIDKKTGVITISTQAQDPLIARTLADSVKERLQEYITTYRTNKARIDVEYYRQLVAEAKCEYDSVRRQYAICYDSHAGELLRRVSVEQEMLEREMEMKYNTYTTMAAQYQAAMAKVQERTPAFTLFKGAEVPVKHSGPKRMLIVIGLLFVSGIVTSAYILKEDIKRQLSRR